MFASFDYKSSSSIEASINKIIILAIEANAGQVDSMLELAHIYYEAGLRKYRLAMIKDKSNYEFKKAYNYFEMCAEKRKAECLYYSALMQ